MTRIGLIGAGRWGKNAARALKSAGVLAWVADADIEAAWAVASAHMDDPDALVHPLWPECDAVWICTPIETHELLVHTALSAGKHVLCEKPLARTKAQAEGLAADARRRGLTLMCDFTWEAHEGVMATVSAEGVVRYGATRHAKDERGFDPIEDLLPHDVALACRAFRGPVVGVAAAPVEADPTLTFVGLRFAGGHPSVKTPRGPTMRNFASIYYSYERNEKVRKVETWSESAHHANDGSLPPGSPEPLTVIVSEFLAAIAEKREPTIGNAAEYIHVAAVIEAAKESRKCGGEWVDVQQ